MDEPYVELSKRGPGRNKLPEEEKKFQLTIYPKGKYIDLLGKKRAREVAIAAVVEAAQKIQIKDEKPE